jgi:hypothetical protein
MSDPRGGVNGGTITDLGSWPRGLVTSDDRARFARYAEATAFYEGDQWLSKRRRGEARLTFNYGRGLVRKVASYVFPAPVTFSVPERGDDAASQAAASRAERALADVAAELDLGRLDIELCVDGSVLGDAAIKVTWDAAAAGGRGGPVVAPVDPATLVATWAPDNPRRVLRVTQLYALSGAAIAALFSGEDASGRGVETSNAAFRLLDLGRVYPVVESWTPEQWSVEVAGQTVRDEANPYGWIPYLIAPNNPRPHAFWGESDLADLYDVCRELNSRMSVLSSVLEMSGSPIAVLENVDGSEGISVGPGAKWELPEGARAYLLDLLGGGGVGLHVQYLDLLYRALHDLSETPRTAFGDSGRDLSGAALEVEIQPLVQKVQRKRRGWEALFRQRNALLLDLLERFGGLDLGGLRRTVTIWPSVLPSDRDGAVRNAAQLVAGGIHSRRTAVASLGGDDADAEFARVLEETERLRSAGTRNED